MGVPIRVDGEMIGFLSLGSLQEGIYHHTDAALVTTFTNQLSDVLEEAWKPEPELRESDKLEVISRLSHALGQVESKEDTYRAILEQVNTLFGPVEGAFLFPDNTSSNLIVRFASDEACLGLGHPRQIDFLWQALETGNPVTILDIAEFLHQSPPELYRTLLKRKKTAIILPLKSQEFDFRHSPAGIPTTPELHSRRIPRIRYDCTDHQHHLAQVVHPGSAGEPVIRGAAAVDRTS